MLNAGGGSIVFTSSFVGHTIGFPQMADYAASKAGLIGLTRALAADYASFTTGIALLADGGVSISRT